MSLKVLAALAVIAAGATGAAALPASTSARSSGAREITVREKVQSIHFIHQQRSTKGDRLANGDRVLTRQRLFNANAKPIGWLFTDCVNVGASASVFAATLECTASYRFADGQLVATGLISFGAPGSATPLAGSGAYRGVRGEVTSAKPENGYDVDVLHLDS